MDFSYLLELAKANEEKSKSDSSIKFSTKISNAKKIDRAGPKPEAVNQLLNRIESEKRKKEEEYEKKKQNLLAIRAENNHSKKRVRCLINRTKGASKAVLEDAKDIGTAKCETQCDEDDYGYESAMSQKIFSKLQNVYRHIPDDERLKFKSAPKASIEEIKQRVMSSLKEKQEEELGIRKRKRNRKKKNVEEDDGFINDGDEYKHFKNKSEKTKEEGEKEKKRHSKSDKKVSSDFFSKDSKKDKYSSFKYDSEKPKNNERVEKKKSNSKSAPPPMSFEELLKVAQKKQVEPLPIIDPLEELEKQKEKAKDIERPLTAKEKKELEEAKIRRLRRMGKLPPEKPSVKGKTDKDSASKPEQKAAKPSKTAVEDEPQEKSSKNYDKSRFFAVPNKPSSVLSSNNKNVPASNSKSLQAPSKSLPPPKVSQEPQKSKIPSRSRSPPPYPTKKPPSSYPTKKPPPYYPTKKPPPSPPTKKPPPSFPTKKPQPLPSRKPLTPAYSPPYFPTRKSGPPPKRRIDSDDEDEYDSEMDDFIDDGEEDMDYSSEIARLFKYDKSKFRDIDEDDDDAAMEASFSQMEKEEKISAKIGLMEDLEDIRREEEEKKRKKKRMKSR